jgi:hypothetical protein
MQIKNLAVIFDGFKIILSCESNESIENFENKCRKTLVKYLGIDQPVKVFHYVFHF